ncbi:MAG: four helix bundle protein [Cyclobacteriaceae bacterium]|nr:four helix bundle protein [Cyclobacteriaceae bacterium]
MDQIKSYADLEVWKNAKNLAKEIYLVTNSFPTHEQYGLVAQLRRASVSVPSNIAEGCGRNSSKDTVRFLFIARGGLYEIETQIILAHELGFITHDETKEKILEMVNTSKKLLNGFISYYSKLDSSIVNEPEELYRKHDQQPATDNEQL